MTETDFSQRFIFDNHDVRGDLVSLECSYAHVLAKHPYPQPVAELLGQMMAAAVLLAGTIKFEGLLILQATSVGPVSLAMVECSSSGEIRAIARYVEAEVPASLELQQMLPDGVLAITIEPKDGQRYQGLVALNGESMAACLDDYFASSEQLATKFWLQADGRRARGMLLQQLPVQKVTDNELRAAGWEHLCTMAHTLSVEELLALDNQTLLYRLYHDEQVRIFDEQEVVFSCSCSKERSANALESLGIEDALALLQERGGVIEVDCQFCNQKYSFRQEDVTALFATKSENSSSSTVH